MTLKIENGLVSIEKLLACHLMWSFRNDTSADQNWAVYVKEIFDKYN